MIFINPDCFEGYRFPSMGMLYIASALERRGLPASYIDANYEPDWRDRLAREAPAHEWIGITANVLSIGPALEVARHIRECHKDKKIILGGPYPAVCYAELIPEYADACAVGSGFVTRTSRRMTGSQARFSS